MSLKLRDDEKIVYRVGDFSRKSTKDDLQNLDLGRSSGFFGYGHYFCTTWEKCASQGGGDRPLYSMNVEDYNFIWGTNSLHESLKWLNKYLSFYPLTKFDMKKWWEIFYCLDKWIMDYDFAEYLEQDFEWEKEQGLCENFQEYIQDDYHRRTFLEIIKDLEEFKDLYKELTLKKPNWKKLQQLYDSNIYLDKEVYKRAEDLVRDKQIKLIHLDLSENKFDSICDEIYKELEHYYEDGILRRRNVPYGLDSIPTMFLKMLGYDGVYPSLECDNITQGGCIFETDKLKDVTLLSTDVSKYKG